MARSYVESRQGSDRDEMDRVKNRTMTAVNSWFVDLWRAISNQNERGRGMTCSPLEAKSELFACVAGVREKRREQGQDEEKHMFTDVKQAHFVAKCEQEEWVELPDEFKSEKGSARMGE